MYKLTLLLFYNVQMNLNRTVLGHHFDQPYLHFSLINTFKMISGKDASLNLKLCEVEGSDRTHTYREGEIFTPLNTRKTCLCTPAWNNSVSDSYCRDINCGLELAFQNEIMKNCAPVFASNQRDCPINFVCRKYFVVPANQLHF